MALGRSHPSTRKKVEAALLKVAAEAGVSPAELEERSVPTFGLGPDSRSLHTIGGHTAELRIAGGGAPELVWRRPDGRSQKTVPAAVRAEHPYELGQLRKTLRELRAVAAGQSARVERLLVGDRVWDLSSWRQRYADHPLVRGVARRLLWSLVVNCQLQPCLVGDDGFETADGEVLGCTRVDAEVRLWHPLESTPEQVCAVRALLVERGIVQPFKQAHRENYVITDAELTTSSYSN